VALSTRERYIALAVGGAVVLAALDRLLIDPFLERSRAIADQRLEIEGNIDKAESTFKRKLALRRVWSDMTTIGGLKSDASEAKSQTVQSLESWGQESGITWTSWDSKELSQGAIDPKADKPESKFEKISVHATGFGTMAAMTKLLWKAESAPKLLKVTEIHISPRKEATDDLQIQLSVATVSQVPDPVPGETASDNSRPVANAGTGVQP
jgi:hypothetical protein